jgi:hypothetical protein
MLYPDIEIKQYSRMQKAIADINNIKYVEKENRQYETVSVRTFGDVSVKYTLYHVTGTHFKLGEDGGSELYVSYEFESDKNPHSDDCIFDGGFPYVEKYRRFRTNIDKKMWYVGYDDHDGSVYLYRRRFPAATAIYLNVLGNKQTFSITDGMPELEDSGIKLKDYLYDDDDDEPKFDLDYLPQWADKPQ